MTRALYLDERGRIAVRVEPGHGEPCCHLLDGASSALLDGVRDLGRSPDRRWFARVYRDRIDVSDGWDGAPRGFRLPTHYAPLFEPEALGARRVAIGALELASVEVFADGARVLVASSNGIFLCYPDRDALLLWPSGTRVAEAAGAAAAVDLGLRDAHAAVSPDGRFLACGERDSAHVVAIREPDQTRSVHVTPLTGHPLLARFHDRRPLVALASGHGASGGVVQHALASIEGHRDADADEDARADRPDAIELAAPRRIVAIAPLADGWLLGYQSGALWTVGFDGQRRGDLNVGGSCRSLDVSPDGQRLLVGTQSGHLIEAARAADRAPNLLGSQPFVETRRYRFTLSREPFRW